MAFERRTTTQDISWFLDLHKLQQLVLDPPYQRRSVWSPKDRRFFLDTVFNGYPCPAIFLIKEIKDGKSLYEVIDGKQRLETIIRFFEGRIAIGTNFANTSLAGLKFQQLDSEARKKFYNYVLPVEFISIDQGPQQINEVFDRLNRNSRKLTSQELRHAKYEGWFINFVETEADNDLAWQKLKIVTTSKSRRMADVQNISELLMITISNQIYGFKQELIDDFYAKYDNPSEDPVDDFYEDEVKEKFTKTKEFIEYLEDNYSAVSNFSKNFKDFYTLWSVISIKELYLVELDNFNNCYSCFMKMVDQCKLEGLPSSDIHQDARIYYQNNTGASTDHKQRKERHDALSRYINTNMKDIS